MRSCPDAVLPTPAGQASASRAGHDLVADFIARHGVRRFEAGFSADVFHIRQMLAARGIEVIFNPTGVSCTWKQGRGRTERLTRAEFFARIDEMRVAEGLEPMVRR